MKILFLTVKPESPSAKWRVLQFIPHFRRAGVVCDVEEWPRSMLGRLGICKKGAAYDVVFLQKRLLPKLLANRLRKHAKSLVFEFDDVVMLKRTDEGAVRESPARERRFRRIVRIADAVVTTNEYLGELARRAGAPEERVKVFQSVIDLSRWPPRRREADRERVTIGWMGTPSNLPSMEIIRTPLVRLCRRFEGLEVRVVCEEPLSMEDVRLVNRPYAAGTEAEEVAGPEARSRAAVDTSAVLERDLAARAGLGWIGKNTNLLHPELGSYFFIGVVLTTAELAPDAPQPGRCGTCRACLDACPTAAFPEPYVLDARRCISYLTIEHRGAVPDALQASIGDWLFGCDVCQEVCPWNRKAPAARAGREAGRAEIPPLPELLALDDAAWRRRFRGTALWRARRAGLLRNAAIVLGNRGDRAAVPALEAAARDEDSTVREAARRALQRIPA